MDNNYEIMRAEGFSGENECYDANDIVMADEEKAHEINAFRLFKLFVRKKVKQDLSKMQQKGKEDYGRTKPKTNY